MNETMISVWPAGKALHDDFLLRLAEEQPVTERCATCGEFEFVGPLVQARKAFRTHVESEHPHLVRALNTKRLRRSFAPTRRVELGAVAA